MTNRITERMILSALMATITEGISATETTQAIPQADFMDWATRKIAALDKKKASSGLSEKEKAIREVENEKVYAVLSSATSGMTAGQVGQAVTPAPVTPQKATAVLNRLKTAGKARSVTDKGVTYWLKVEG